MATATKTKNATAAEQRAVLRSLDQQVAAELIGKPAVWLRDNADKANRNPDGTYDGRALVATVLGLAPVASLSDDNMEGVLQVVETCLRGDSRHDLALAAIEAVEKRHGTAGLAAVGAELLAHLREWASLDPNGPKELPAETDYVERFAEEARQRHRTIAIGWDARQQGRELFTCEKCQRYRLGKTWSAPPLPSGYAPHRMETICPRCSSRR